MVFIPRWEKYRDKKPSSAEYDCNSDFCNLFDAFYVFDSFNPDDLIGVGGRLSRIASPGDGGTSTLGGKHDYGVTVTANDVASGTTQSTKFRADTATGDASAFWHKDFARGSFFADCTLSAIVGGPMNLFGVGGKYNGAELMYRANPKKLSLITSNSYNKAEAQSTSVFNPDNSRIKILGVFDNGTLKLFVLHNETATLEAQTTAPFSNVGVHTAKPDILGAGSSNALGDTSYAIVGDGWNGDCYSLGISKSYAPSDEEALAFLEAPYQVLKPRRRYFLLPSAAANSAALSGSAAASAGSTATVHADIPLAGLSTTVSHGSGAVSASLPLAGASAAIAGGTAGISAQVSLSAAAMANTLAEAGLSLDALLSGAGDTTTTGAGSLNATAASAGLAAAGSASAHGQGNIVLQATLSGAAISTALAEAGLVTGQALAGSAQSSASAAGTLIQDIPLSGNSHAVASGAGNVSAVLPLSASAASAANMTGGLTVSVDFSAAALAHALAQAGLDATTLSGLAGAGDAASTASGTLQLSVPLDGQALIRAVGSGVLSQGVQAIPQIGRWTVRLNSRRYALCV